MTGKTATSFILEANSITAGNPVYVPDSGWPAEVNVWRLLKYSVSIVSPHDRIRRVTYLGTQQ